MRAFLRVPVPPADWVKCPVCRGRGFTTPVDDNGVHLSDVSTPCTAAGCEEGTIKTTVIQQNVDLGEDEL